MQKVATQNTLFCAKRCKTFDDILNQDWTPKQERQHQNCFQNCLGKHTDSLEMALDQMQAHLAKKTKPTFVTHSDDIGDASRLQYLLSQNSTEPVYDTPIKQSKN